MAAGEVLARAFSPQAFWAGRPGALPQATIARAVSPPVVASRHSKSGRSELLDHAIEFFKMIPPRKQSQT
jgi:hypothetical protein